MVCLPSSYGYRASRHRPIFRCRPELPLSIGLARSRHRTARSSCVGQGTALRDPPGAAVDLSWQWAAQVRSYDAHVSALGSCRRQDCRTSAAFCRGTATLVSCCARTFDAAVGPLDCVRVRVWLCIRACVRHIVHACEQCAARAWLHARVWLATAGVLTVRAVVDSALQSVHSGSTTGVGRLRRAFRTPAVGVI